MVRLGSFITIIGGYILIILGFVGLSWGIFFDGIFTIESFVDYLVGLFLVFIGFIQIKLKYEYDSEKMIVSGFFKGSPILFKNIIDIDCTNWGVYLIKTSIKDYHMFLPFKRKEINCLIDAINKYKITLR